MTKQERYDLYQRAVEKWGEDSQFDQMIEEMAELTVALNKFKRAKHFVAQKKEGVLENIYEELADVKMCLEQMEWIFGEENVNSTLEEKFKKFIKQLNE